MSRWWFLNSWGLSPVIIVNIGWLFLVINPNHSGLRVPFPRPRWARTHWSWWTSWTRCRAVTMCSSSLKLYTPNSSNDRGLILWQCQKDLKCVSILDSTTRIPSAPWTQASLHSHHSVAPPYLLHIESKRSRWGRAKTWKKNTTWLKVPARVEHVFAMHIRKSCNYRQLHRYYT